MDNARKPAEPPQVTAQPGAQKHVPQAVPGEESSKAPSGQRDGRTGQDKDGNEDRTKPSRKPG